jgi:hypothetical protein
VLAFLRSLWTGSQAIVGLVSLLVVTPVVAFYLPCTACAPPARSISGPACSAMIDWSLAMVAGIVAMLDPIADRLERFGIGRLAATFVILAVFLLLLVVVLTSRRR